MNRLIVGGLVLLLAACATTGSAPVIAPDVDIFHETTDGRISRYDVSPTGRIRFAGGYPARDGQWSWTGQITPEQGAAMTKAINAGGLMQWHSTGLATGNVWKVTIKQDGKRNSFTSTGTPEALEHLWKIVQAAGSQRLQADLDKLPKPDIDRLVERQRHEAATETNP